MKEAKKPSPEVRRWYLELKGVGFRVEHIPGKNNSLADALSRLCDEHAPFWSTDIGVPMDADEADELDENLRDPIYQQTKISVFHLRHLHEYQMTRFPVDLNGGCYL